MSPPFRNQKNQKLTKLSNNSKNIQSRVRVLVHDTSSHCALQLFHSNSFNGCQFTKWTQNSTANDQREITPKYPKQSYGSCT